MNDLGPFTLNESPRAAPTPSRRETASAHLLACVRAAYDEALGPGIEPHVAEALWEHSEARQRALQSIATRTPLPPVDLADTASPLLVPVDCGCDGGLILADSWYEQRCDHCDAEGVVMVPLATDTREDAMLRAGVAYATVMALADAARHAASPEAASTLWRRHARAELTLTELRERLRAYDEELLA